jgi:hypothetical protein
VRLEITGLHIFKILHQLGLFTLAFEITTTLDKTHRVNGYSESGHLLSNFPTFNRVGLMVIRPDFPVLYPKFVEKFRQFHNEPGISKTHSELFPFFLETPIFVGMLFSYCHACKTIRVEQTSKKCQLFFPRAIP